MKEIVKSIAQTWFDGGYNEQQARLSASLQGVEWVHIEFEYGRLYAESECLGAGRWN